ncbi:hypothetical protein Fot_43050 [Forsythia ovata]|uniref:Uncharacterized protein n=1 Tax=Forsythia ovata TaxID=205694 RepID=A0ABD1RPR3_9LAMI
MTGFYFSNVPKLKIRRGGVVDDILPPPPVLHAVFVPEIAISHALEAVVSIFSSVPLVPEITAGAPSVLLPTGPVFLSENFRRPVKRKAVVDSEGETTVPEKGMWDVGIFRRLGEVGRIILRGLRIAFSMIEERPEPLFLLIMLSLNMLTLDIDRTNWTLPFWENCRLRSP